MNTISYVKEVPAAKLFFGFVLMLLGFVMLFSLSFFAFILFGFGCFLIIREGSEVNLADKTYRMTNSFLGIKFGKWMPLPEFEYVSVFKTRETQRINGAGASASFASDIIYLNLFDDKNRCTTFYKTENKEKAFEVAEHFRTALGIDILDATQAEKVWL